MLGQIAALDRKDRMKILLTHNYLAVQNICKKFGETSFDRKYLEKHLYGNKRKYIKKILDWMFEIEKMCSTTIPKGTKVKNYHGSPLHAHI